MSFFSARPYIPFLGRKKHMGASVLLTSADLFPGSFLFIVVVTMENIKALQILQSSAKVRICSMLRNLAGAYGTIFGFPSPMQGSR